jgi:hypothetical protein
MGYVIGWCRSGAAAAVEHNEDEAEWMVGRRRIVMEVLSDDRGTLMTDEYLTGVLDGDEGKGEGDDRDKDGDEDSVELVTVDRFRA